MAAVIYKRSASTFKPGKATEMSSVDSGRTHQKLTTAFHELQLQFSLREKQKSMHTLAVLFLVHVEMRQNLQVCVHFEIYAVRMNEDNEFRFCM